MTVAWDFGDGTTATASRGDPVRHTYTASGEHVVTAELEDAELAISKPVTARFRNLLASDNLASVEDGTLDGWNAPPPEATSSDERALHGNRSLRLQATDMGWDYPFGEDTIELGDIGGRPVTFMCGLFLDVWPSGATLNVRYRFQREDGYSLLSAGASLDVSVSGQWTQQRFTRVAPAGAHRFRIDEFRTGGAGPYNTRRCYLDRFGLFLGEALWDDWSLPSEFAA